MTSKKTLYSFHHKAFLSSNALISTPDKQAQILKIAQQARQQASLTRITSDVTDDKFCNLAYQDLTLAARLYGIMHCCLGQRRVTQG